MKSGQIIALHCAQLVNTDISKSSKPKSPKELSAQAQISSLSKAALPSKKLFQQRTRLLYI